MVSRWQTGDDVREYLLVFLVATAVTYLLTVLAREIALRLGAVAGVRDRDVHAEPVPYLGGVAMYGGMVAAFLVARELPFLSRSYDFVFSDAAHVLIAGAVICAVGVVDDIIELDALSKLGGQVIAAGILVWFGIQYNFFYLPDGRVISENSQAAALSVFAVLATANAVNFVDGLDGLAAGVVGVGATAFFVFCYQIANLNQLPLATTGALLSAMLAGACAGFLVHNFHPARIFMGDSGSMLLGLMLTASAMTLTAQFNPADLEREAATGQTWLIFLLPVMVSIAILVVPLSDLTLSIIRRTSQLKPFFHPDKQHLHHRLLELGHSHRRAVLVMWSWAALFGFGTVLAVLYGGRTILITLGLMLLLTLAATFLLPRIRGTSRAPSEHTG